MSFRKRSRSARGRSGVSLVETLVAIGVLSIAMGTLAQLVFSGLQASAAAERQVSGALLAQERMEDLLAHRADLPAWEKVASSQFPFDKEAELYGFERTQWEDYRWMWEITDVQGNQRLKRVNVKVQWRLPRAKEFRGRFDLFCLLAVPVHKGAGQEPAGGEVEGAQAPGEPTPADETGGVAPGGTDGPGAPVEGPEEVNG